MIEAMFVDRLPYDRIVESGGHLSQGVSTAMAKLTPEQVGAFERVEGLASFTMRNQVFADVIIAACDFICMYPPDVIRSIVAQLEKDIQTREVILMVRVKVFSHVIGVETPGTLTTTRKREGDATPRPAVTGERRLNFRTRA
jgi:hypothetical protein